MNKEVLKRNIEQVIMQPCNAIPCMQSRKNIRVNGLSDDEKFIIVKVWPDDTSCKFDLVDRDGNPIDYVEGILEMLPKKYRDHLVTLRHTELVSWSYLPVFDTETQTKWDEEVSDYIKYEQDWCDKYGCE